MNANRCKKPQQNEYSVHTAHCTIWIAVISRHEIIGAVINCVHWIRISRMKCRWKDYLSTCFSWSTTAQLKLQKCVDMTNKRRIIRRNVFLMKIFVQFFESVERMSWIKLNGRVKRIGTKGSKKKLKRKLETKSREKKTKTWTKIAKKSTKTHEQKATASQKKKCKWIFKANFV